MDWGKTQKGATAKRSAAHASDSFRPYCYDAYKIIGLRQWRVFSQLTWLLRTIPLTHSGRSIDGDEEYVTGECLWRQNFQLVTTVSIWIHIIKCYMIMEYSRTLSKPQLLMQLCCEYRRNRDFRVQPDSAVMILFHGCSNKQYDLGKSRERDLTSAGHNT